MSARQALLLLCLMLAACNGSKVDETKRATLYRNSFTDHSLRVHWASFDAPDGFLYNIGNCMMAARILNANVDASAKAEGKDRDKAIGFWCEPGAYRETGSIPLSFESKFPADA